jgi:very-short-patch-repair endonuclease
MIQLLRAVDVPDPARQFPVGDNIRLDLAFPDAGLFIEIDGRTSHDRPEALLYDRHRQNAVVAHLGWNPLRYTWDDITSRPGWTARDVERCYHQALTAADPTRAHR